MYVYIITCYGQVTTIGFKTENEAFDWLLNHRKVRRVMGYDFERGYQIRKVKIIINN